MTRVDTQLAYQPPTASSTGCWRKLSGESCAQRRVVTSSGAKRGYNAVTMTSIRPGAIWNPRTRTSIEILLPPLARRVEYMEPYRFSPAELAVTTVTEFVATCQAEPLLAAAHRQSGYAGPCRRAAAGLSRPA